MLFSVPAKSWFYTSSASQFKLAAFQMFSSTCLEAAVLDREVLDQITKYRLSEEKRTMKPRLVIKILTEIIMICFFLNKKGKDVSMRCRYYF